MPEPRHGRLDPDDPRHGTYNAYVNHGCRCAMCSAASTRYKARRRAAHNPTPPERRRPRPGYDPLAFDREILAERRLLAEIERRVVAS
jgi:hypothetical protein